MATRKLFTEFEPTSTETWEEKILLDLKGGDYAKRLVTRTIEGIDIKPYYRDEDLNNLDHLFTNPGEFPFVRTNNLKDNYHEIRQDIIVFDFEDANRTAKDAIYRGVSSLAFDLNEKKSVSCKDFSLILSGIDIEHIEINFLCGILSEEILTHLINYISEKGLNGGEIRGSLDYDPIGYKTFTGKCYSHQNKSCTFSDKYKLLVDLTNETLPNFKILTVNAHHFRNAGSTAVQELAFALAMGSDYLEKAREAGISIDVAASKFMFSFGVSSDYFIEISKIRASRLLWAKVVEAYEVNVKSSCDMYIHSVTCDWNKTAYDPYVNVLRTTTEAMSAILGGTDSLTVKPFDSSFEKPDKFSERIARNIQIILKEEAYFDKAVDPAGGSYFIENLTNSIAEHAWSLFTQIEAEGGYHIALDKGTIKSMIDETARQRDMNIAQRKEILLGTNQYPNKNEMIEKIEKFYDTNSEEAIKLYRGASAFEEIRQKTEKSEKIPKVFLLTMGNLSMRKARASFSANFFACAGFEIIESEGNDNVQDAVDESLKINADITVICSSDEEYSDIVPCIYEKIKDNSIVVVAGYPKNCIDALMKFGVKHFIHMKSNVIEVLKLFQNELGL